MKSSITTTSTPWAGSSVGPNAAVPVVIPTRAIRSPALRTRGSGRETSRQERSPAGHPPHRSASCRVLKNTVKGVGPGEDVVAPPPSQLISRRPLVKGPAALPLLGSPTAPRNASTVVLDRGRGGVPSHVKLDKIRLPRPRRRQGAGCAHKRSGKANQRPPRFRHDSPLSRCLPTLRTRRSSRRRVRQSWLRLRHLSIARWAIARGRTRRSRHPTRWAHGIQAVRARSK